MTRPDRTPRPLPTDAELSILQVLWTEGPQTVRDVLEHLEMVANDEETPALETVECSRSFWLYTEGGGMLEVFPDLTDEVKEGDQVAQLINEWGEVHQTYCAPADGVVIGKATNPVAQSGSRILHMGIKGHVETTRA